MKILYNWLNTIQYSVLPPVCVVCGQQGENERDLCSACSQLLPRNNTHCQRCAVPLRVLGKGENLCERCLCNPPAFDTVFAPFLYQGIIADWIKQLKFQQDYKNARLLGELFVETMQYTVNKPDSLLPIPLHTRRYYQRGFNQTIEIARVISREWKLPLDLHSCVRRENTQQQAVLTREQRLQNMKNAFAIKRVPQARHIALFDDVMTTGATAHELAFILKQAGITRVDVWICARA
jgi:ComF family protein